MFSSINLHYSIEFRNSIQVTDENDDPVTPQVIAQDSPFYVVYYFLTLIFFFN